MLRRIGEVSVLFIENDISLVESGLNNILFRIMNSSADTVFVSLNELLNEWNRINGFLFENHCLFCFVYFPPPRQMFCRHQCHPQYHRPPLVIEVRALPMPRWRAFIVSRGLNRLPPVDVCGGHDWLSLSTRGRFVVFWPSRCLRSVLENSFSSLEPMLSDFVFPISFISLEDQVHRVRDGAANFVRVTLQCIRDLRLDCAFVRGRGWRVNWNEN